MNRTNQSGSHLIAVAFAVLVVGVVAFGGYRVWQMQQAASTNNAADTTASTTVPAKIINTTTLKQAGTVLDSSSAQLNSSLDDSALNADLNSML